MIEVGDFVRIKSGIAKVLEVKTVQPKMYGKHDVAYLIDKCPRMYITETEFIKHSKNLIDLIEVGDFVNGILVTGKESTLLYTEIKGIDNSDYYIPFSQYGENIKSVLTHEQYTQKSYKVEGEE